MYMWNVYKIFCFQYFFNHDSAKILLILLCFKIKIINYFELVTQAHQLVSAWASIKLNHFWDDFV